MKIVYIVEAVNLQGGYDRIIIEKANYLAEHGHDVTITVSSHSLGKPFYPLSKKLNLVDFDINFHRQYGHNIIFRYYIYFTCMRRYRHAVSDFLLKNRPDVVISTLGREMDFLTEIHDGSIKLAESHIARDFVRNFHLLENRSFLYRLIARYWRHKMDRAVHNLDALVLLTQHDADSWAGLTKTYVIPNSIPFYPSCSSSCDNKVVIFVGRFNEQKGLEYLIKTWESTFKKHRDWTLHIYGDGDQKEMLYQLISKAGLEKGVKVHQPTKKIMEKYLESSIFLLTSRFEGLPMVIVEAMACGLPVVSFDCPYGPADIIQNGEDGYLVEYLNTDEAALKVCELIENPELRKQMSRNARENIKRFDRNVIMKKWVDLFEILCNEKKH